MGKQKDGGRKNEKMVEDRSKHPKQKMWGQKKETREEVKTNKGDGRNEGKHKLDGVQGVQEGASKERGEGSEQKGERGKRPTTHAKQHISNTTSTRPTTSPRQTAPGQRATHANPVPTRGHPLLSPPLPKQLPPHAATSPCCARPAPILHATSTLPHPRCTWPPPLSHCTKPTHPSAAMNILLHENQTLCNTPKGGGRRRVGGAEGWGGKFRAFFLCPPLFSFFLPLLGRFVEFWWRY